MGRHERRGDMRDGRHERGEGREGGKRRRKGEEQEQNQFIFDIFTIQFCCFSSPNRIVVTREREREREET